MGRGIGKGAAIDDTDRNGVLEESAAAGRLKRKQENNINNTKALMTQKGTSMENKAAAARRKYMKEWRKRNRDRVKAYNERYWNRKAEEAEADTEEQEKGSE